MEGLTASTGGYGPLPWVPPFERQLPCLHPEEHAANAACAICLECVEGEPGEDGTVGPAQEKIVMTVCGHWVCGACDLPRRTRIDGATGVEVEIPLQCPICNRPLEPRRLLTRRTRRRALRFPFCLGRPSVMRNLVPRRQVSPELF